MNLKCLIGMHEWAGCKCSKCGKSRDEGHDWATDCEKCSKCGAVREGLHQWNGCKCSKCSQARDEGHTWTQDCERCSKCGKTREDAHDWTQDCERCSKCGALRENVHQWDGCKCTKCGKTRDEGHDWSRGCEKCSKCGKAREEGHDFLNEQLTCTICGASADVNTKDKQGFSLLHVAVKNGNANVAALLIARGADVNGTNNTASGPWPVTGFTPLHVADKGRADVVKLLIDHGADVNAKLSTGFTPLADAAGKGHADVVKLLLHHGADINLSEPIGRAAGKGRADVVKLLIDHGADVNVGEWTPLHSAVFNGHADVVKLLLDHGADINAKIQAQIRIVGWTAVNLAAGKGNLELVRLLIANGADLNAPNAAGDGALHSAASEGHLQIAELLIASGADVNAKAVDGNTPLDLAMKARHEGLQNLLAANGGCAETHNQGHKWVGCKCVNCGKEVHVWDGCKCTKCGKTRDINHDWSEDCLKCRKCGVTRNGSHTWDGCKCTECGITRDMGHAWSKSPDKCSRCGIPIDQVSIAETLRNLYSADPRELSSDRCLLESAEIVLKNRSGVDVVAVLAAMPASLLDSAVVEVAKRAKESRETDALSAIICFTWSRSSVAVANAVHFLARSGSQRAVAPLSRVVTFEAQVFRNWSEYEFVHFGLFKEDIGAATRAAAAIGLANLKAKNATESLILALKDPSWKVRSAAVEALRELDARVATDPIVDMLKGAPSDKYVYGRSWDDKVDVNLDQMAWGYREALRALGAFNREDVLAELAIALEEEKNDDKYFTYTIPHRIADYALYLTRDVHWLTVIASSAKNRVIRVVAGKRALVGGGTVTDQQLLKSIMLAIGDGISNWSLLKKAFSLVTDETILEEIVMSDLHGFGFEASEKIVSSKALERIVEQTSSMRIRTSALSRIENDELIVRYALSSEDLGVAETAARKVTNPNVLESIAENSCFWQLRLLAVDKIDDVACLKRVVENDLDGSVADAAASRLRSIGITEIPQYLCPSTDTERSLMHLRVVSSTAQAMEPNPPTSSRRVGLAQAAVLFGAGKNPFLNDEPCYELTAILREKAYCEDRVQVLRVSRTDYEVRFLTVWVREPP